MQRVGDIVLRVACQVELEPVIALEVQLIIVQLDKSHRVGLENPPQCLGAIVCSSLS